MPRQILLFKLSRQAQLSTIHAMQVNISRTKQQSLDSLQDTNKSTALFTAMLRHLGRYSCRSSHAQHLTYLLLIHFTMYIVLINHLCSLKLEDGLQWSCAKQLKPQLGTPTPHAFPSDIVPTIRGQPWRDVAHPQTSRLVTAGASQQQQQQQQRQQHGCDDGLATDLFSSDKLYQTHGDTVSPAAASCSDADASADVTCPMQPISIAAEQASVTAANQQEEEAELTLACQQLAEAAAKHAKQRAVLDQALLAPKDQPSTHLQAADAALLAPANCNRHETDCSAACGEPVEAASVSNRHLTATLDAAAMDQVQEGGASCLSAACRELAHVASAHAAQRAQLDSLLQCQLAASTITPAHANLTASKTRDCAMHQHQHMRSTRRLTTAAKGKALGKVGGKHKQSCSAADTAAWPPGPEQHIGVGQDHPSNRDSSRRHGDGVKVADSVETHADSPMFMTPLAEASRVADLLASDAHSCGLTSPLADTASAEQWPPAAAMPGGLSAHQGCLHLADADSILQSHCQMPISSAGMTAAGTGAPDLCVPDNRVCSAGHTSGSGAEPSFGTVHGMLAALQLPNLSLPLLSHPRCADVDRLVILAPVEESLKDDQAGQGQSAVVRQPPGGYLHLLLAQLTCNTETADPLLLLLQPLLSP